MAHCEPGSRNWLRNGAASATGVWGCYWPGKGVRINRKKLYRLYREERLTVRKRGGRRRALGTRAPMAIPQEPNQRWSLDFVYLDERAVMSALGVGADEPVAGPEVC